MHRGTREMSKFSEINKQDALDHVNKFYTTSYAWRSQAYHSRWNLWENNYHSIYPQSISSRKESWQSRLFWPLMFKTVEGAVASIMKVLFGKNQPIKFKRRAYGDELQAQLCTELLDYEIMKARQGGDGQLTLSFHDALKEASMFGSSFIKMFYEVETEQRLIKIPTRNSYKDFFKDVTRIPGAVNGTKMEKQSVIIHEGVKYKHVSIRDIFLEPNSTDLRRLIHRDKITFGELLAFAKKGFFDKDEVEKIRFINEGNDFEQALTISDSSTAPSADIFNEKNTEADAQDGITYPILPRVNFDKEHTVWEFYGPIPRRFLNIALDPHSDAGNELVDGKIFVASGKFLLGVFENDAYDARPPLVQLDYIRQGATYGKGLGEILEGIQEEMNEIHNQRLDNHNLIMNKMLAILEDAIVDPDELVSQPGGIIRIQMRADDKDIKKAIMPIDFPDLGISSYRETQELSAEAQDVSSVTKLTLGTTGKELNQTLGGMELLRQSSNDRFLIYSYLMARKTIIPIAEKTLQLVYQYRSKESIKRILGNAPIEYMPGLIVAKYKLWKDLPPHELLQNYDIVPADVFGDENNIAKIQMIQQLTSSATQMVKAFDPLPSLKMMYRLAGFTEEEITDMLAVQENFGPQPTALAQGQGQPSIASPSSGPSGGPPLPAVPGQGGPY